MVEAGIIKCFAKQYARIEAVDRSTAAETIVSSNWAAPSLAIAVIPPCSHRCFGSTESSKEANLFGTFVSFALHKVN